MNSHVALTLDYSHRKKADGSFYLHLRAVCCVLCSPSMSVLVLYAHRNQLHLASQPNHQYGVLFGHACHDHPGPDQLLGAGSYFAVQAHLDDKVFVDKVQPKVKKLKVF